MHEWIVMSLFRLSSHLLHLAETALVKGKDLLHRIGILTFIKAGGVFMQQKCMGMQQGERQGGKCRGDRKVKRA